MTRRKIALPAAAALMVLGLMVAAQSATATHVRPKAATPFYASLVPAYQPCTTPNRTHAAPLNYGSCNPPVQSSQNVTVGSPDFNGAVANGSGFVKLVVTGSAPTPNNDADVAIFAQVLDVRCQGATTACGSANTAAGPDYVGGLQARLTFQITDHNNNDPNVPGDPYDEPATGTYADFPVNLACSNTATNIGASCSATTTANAIIPGTAVENKRAIYEINQAQVWDGGPDGVIGTAGDQLFEVQGIFIP